MTRLWRIRREEAVAALLFAAVIAAMQWLMISKFWVIFANFGDGSFAQFMRNYHMSGFDPITYDVVTHWHQGYDSLRHPMLAFLFYPVHALNSLLWSATGVNCVQLTVGAILTFCGFYSMIFVRRTIHYVVGVSSALSTLMTMFLLSFGYILVTIIVADHFCLSMLMLTMTVYMAGARIKLHRTFSPCETATLLILTSGITLSNGPVVLAVIAIANGRQMLNRRQMAAVCISVMVTAACVVASTMAKNEPQRQNLIAEQMEWTNTEVSRTAVMQQNLFGESLQLHRSHILGDVLRGRPLTVGYSHWAQDMAIVIIQAMFLLGLAVAWRQRLAWILAGIFAFNVMLHIVLSFAIEEVYIMAAHWTFVIPIAISYLLITPWKWVRHSVTAATALITLYFFIYHGVLLYRYLTWHLVE